MILPTKTSRLWIHMYSGSENFLSTLSQVTSTSWADDLHLFILVAVILSSVNRLLITPNHQALISCGSWCFSCITLSHLSIHMRCAASKIRICRSLLAPLLFLALCCASLLFVVLFHASLSCPMFGVLIAKQPTPRIKPRFICGHFVGSCGQRYLARSQIRLTGVAWQDIMMCDINSVVLHMLHVPLCSWFQMLNHTLPIIWVLCIDLKRNCWTLSLMVHFLMLLHIVSSVSRASR